LARARPAQLSGDKFFTYRAVAANSDLPVLSVYRLL